MGDAKRRREAGDVPANDPLIQLLEIGERHVRTMLLNAHQDAITPFYHLVSGREGVEDRLVVARWNSEADKRAIVAKVKEIAREIDAKRAMFVGEGWMLQIEGGRENVGRVLDYGPVREHPARIEVVQLAAFDGERTKARLFRILRDRPGGQIVGLKKDKETDRFEGRLVDGIIPHG